MNDLIEILKYIIPSLIVCAVVFYLIKAFLDSDLKKRTLEMKQKGQNVLIPIRLQAYERVVLLLERISPTNLVMRINKPELMANHLRLKLLNTVREEFDHNLSQQLYLSSQAWELIKNAKEEVVKLINTAAADMNDDAQGQDLSKKIIELSIAQSKSPISIALEYIKKEIRELF
jgi:hypothetical protein